MCKASSNMPYIKAIQYLTADYQPTRVQTAQGIQRLTKDLAAFDLTKAEKLQIVNLTPVEPVELYVVRSSPSSPSSHVHSYFYFREQIVEELEDRLGNCMEEVLGVVRSSLTAPPPFSAAASTVSATGAELAAAAQPRALEIVDETPASAVHDDLDLDAPLWEHDPNEVEMEYVDGGEGIGIEGDLDVDDDE
jgi:RNA polymerase Rpb4